MENWLQNQMQVEYKTVIDNTQRICSLGKVLESNLAKCRQQMTNELIAERNLRGFQSSSAHVHDGIRQIRTLVDEIQSEMDIVQKKITSELEAILVEDAVRRAEQQERQLQVEHEQIEKVKCTAAQAKANEQRGALEEAFQRDVHTYQSKKANKKTQHVADLLSLDAIELEDIQRKNKLHSFYED